MSEDRRRPPITDVTNYSITGQFNPTMTEDQEHVGVEQLILLDIVPTEGSEEILAQLMGCGFELYPPFEEDPLFRGAIFPKGWSKRRSPNNYHYWVDVLDADDNPRFLMFYKAAAYDRRAFIREIYENE